MSTSEVVRLDKYRSRRAGRLRTAVALSGWRPDRRIRVNAMVRALEITGGDRAVTVWVDELGQGSIRVDHVVDLGSDVPRRSISEEVIELAYTHGVPGLGDVPDRTQAGVLFFPDSPSSSAVVALGSDGSRSWFLIVDSLTPRGRLNPGQREALMFLGGELASVVLDRDAHRLPGQSDSFENARSESFAGWGVLGDLADGTVSDPERDLVNARFLVARVLKCHLEEGLNQNRPGLAEQVGQVRGELERLEGATDEVLETLALLQALERGHLLDVSEQVLDRGRSLEEAGSLHAAREFYLSAYEIAAQCQAAELSVEAAWGLGRSSRRAADWPGAFRWYGIARDVSEALGLWGRHGRVLDGLANAYRDRGNLPGAREQVSAALELSFKIQDPELRSSVLHTSMTVEKLAGEHDLAIVYGWDSVQSQPDKERRLWALLDLAGVFLESGRYAGAEDAFAVVAGTVDGRDAKVLALNGLAQVAAARGDRVAYEGHWRSVEDAEWLKASAIIRGQIMFDRGLSWKDMGQTDRAREWFELALSFGEAQGVGKLILDAEAALEELSSAGPPLEQAHTATPVTRDRRVDKVCQDLASMRQAVPVPLA